MKKRRAEHNSNTITKIKNNDKQTPYRDNRFMQLAIQACIALTAIGTIIIGILLYYHKQTATVWVTFATILFAVLVVCLYWQNSIWKDQKPQSTPFSVQVRSALVSDSGPLTLYMVGYPSMFGQTASPVFYLAFIQITNLQDIASTISEFSVSASKNPEGPWEILQPIPIASVRLFSLGTRTPSPKNILFKHETYRLATPMTTEDMKYAALLNATPALGPKLAKPIQPHDSISGWVALDPPTHKGLTPGQIYFRVSLRDTANKSDNYVVPLPTKKDSSIDINNGSIQVTGVVSDISQFKVRYYSDPLPSHNKSKNVNGKNDQ